VLARARSKLTNRPTLSVTHYTASNNTKIIMNSKSFEKEQSWTRIKMLLRRLSGETACH
jgi:hypothetical protein